MPIDISLLFAANESHEDERVQPFGSDHYVSNQQTESVNQTQSRSHWKGRRLKTPQSSATFQGIMSVFGLSMHDNGNSSVIGNQSGSAGLTIYSWDTGDHGDNSTPQFDNDNNGRSRTDHTWSSWAKRNNHSGGNSPMPLPRSDQPNTMLTSLQDEGNHATPYDTDPHLPSTTEFTIHLVTSSESQALRNDDGSNGRNDTFGTIILQCFENFQSMLFHYLYFVLITRY